MMKKDNEIVLNLKLKKGQNLWREIQSFPKRKINSKQLTKDLEELEDSID